MSFTKVAPSGIGTEPGTSIRIGDSLLHSTGIDIGTGTGIGVTIRKHGDATFTGIVSATAFHGSGANLTGIDATAIQTGNTIIQTSATLISNQISGSGIATVQAGGLDVTGVTTSTNVSVASSVTATTFYGSGANLTGIDATSLKDGSGNVIVQASASAVSVTAGKHVSPASNNSTDLGTSSLRWRDLYVMDLALSNKGKTNDVDGTWGDWKLQEGENDIFMINNRNGKKFKINLTEVE